VAKVVSLVVVVVHPQPFRLVMSTVAAVEKVVVFVVAAAVVAP
jgi:hypothetical protein